MPSIVAYNLMLGRSPMIVNASRMNPHPSFQSDKMWQLGIARLIVVVQKSKERTGNVYENKG
jgi:hypothetical protein